MCTEVSTGLWERIVYRLLAKRVAVGREICHLQNVYKPN